MFRLVWLILIPAKLHIRKIQKEKTPHFSQLLLAIYMTTHIFGTWKILVVFITHVLFITCFCCRKKNNQGSYTGVFTVSYSPRFTVASPKVTLIFIKKSNLFLTQLPSLLSKALSSEDLRTAQWKKSEVVWQKSIWTSFCWMMNATTLCNALIRKKKN